MKGTLPRQRSMRPGRTNSTLWSVVDKRITAGFESESEGDNGSSFERPASSVSQHRCWLC